MIDHTDDPVTVWIKRLQHGESAAAQMLWEHFFTRLLVVAKQKMGENSRRVYDEEDAAQSAFHSLCKGIKAGRFPDLDDRNGLWRLLVTITYRKIRRRQVYDRSQKRNIDRQVLPPQIPDGSTSFSPDHVANLEAIEPAPDFVVQAKENLEQLISQLDNDVLCQICCLKLEGFRDGEIAEKLNCSRRTVQRKIEVIKKIWQNLKDE